MNMPAYFSPRRRPSGFTLIELLIVITIIAILASIAFPVTGSVMRKARETQAQADISAINTAIKGYYLEYGRYPLVSADHGGASDRGVIPTDGAYGLLPALLGYDGGTAGVPNPRQIQFLDPKIASNPRGGFLPTGAGSGAGTYYDPWGTPYEIFIDSNYDNDINNPEGATPATIRKGVLIYSYGIDENLTDWSDNIMSWK